MKYLGIDYGKKKVGLAVSEGLFASGLKTVLVSGLNDAVTKITHIIKQESITDVVIGLAESGESRKMTQSFIQVLQATVPVHVVDEHLSTYRAHEMMHLIGKNQKSRRVVDAHAAVEILQSYLDSLQ